RVEIVGGGQLLDIAVDGVGLLLQPSDAIPLDEGELLQVVDIQQFLGLGGGKIAAACAEKFERIPFGGVVAGSDRDSAGGVQAIDGVLNHGRRCDSQVDDIPAASQERRDHALANHHAARSRIASD